VNGVVPPATLSGFFRESRI